MIIEDLILIKSIGKGAFGEVFLGSKKNVDQKFAVKKVSRGLVYQEKVKKYFNNEIFILKNISHPNIIKLYDIKPFYLERTNFKLCFC
jgi:serine/threonine protein kinase